MARRTLFEELTELFQRKRSRAKSLASDDSFEVFELTIQYGVKLQVTIKRAGGNATRIKVLFPDGDDTITVYPNDTGLGGADREILEDVVRENERAR